MIKMQIKKQIKEEAEKIDKIRYNLNNNQMLILNNYMIIMNLRKMKNNSKIHLIIEKLVIKFKQKKIKKYKALNSKKIKYVMIKTLLRKQKEKNLKYYNQN